MDVDSVLVAYRREAVIADAVGAAEALGGRVVVVDHGDGASAHRAAAMGALAVHDPANPGFGAGVNRGVWCTQSDFVLVCNPDAQVVAEAVEAGVRLLLQRPDVAAVQGVIVNRASGAPERSQGIEVGPVHLLGRAVGARRLLSSAAVRRLARRSRVLADHAERVPDRPREVESLAATALLVRRSAFDAVGGFDESYFLYGEDLDLCRRLRQAGWRLLSVPGVWAEHVSGASAESAVARELYWWRGTMSFAARWWRPRAWRVAVAAATVRWARLAARHPTRARAAFAALVAEPRRERLTPKPAS